jgi:anhydro-N-acetylmuramic acid kinase
MNKLGRTILEKWSLGLMSGTSMDGIDVALIQTDGNKAITLGPTFFAPYIPEFQEKLQSILGMTQKTEAVETIENQLTILHAEAIERLLKKFHISKGDIDVVGFHGHTILHQSPKKHPKGRTWQIGNNQLLANLTGLTVVGNLRENDVAHGGEGAPLVPIFQQALCKGLEKPLVIINIGGVANITWIDSDDLMAFDIGPGNALIDNWIYQHTGQRYDKGGGIAKKGVADKSLLEKWLQHPYFSLTPPKSLDRLDFDFSPQGLSLENGAATLTAFTIETVVEGLKHLTQKPKTIFVAGGGRHNQTLMALLKERCAPISVEAIDSLGWSSDFLEAQAFAYLAKRSLLRLPLTFPKTTGAPYPLTGGITYMPHHVRSSNSIKTYV